MRYSIFLIDKMDVVGDNDLNTELFAQAEDAFSGFLLFRNKFLIGAQISLLIIKA